MVTITILTTHYPPPFSGASVRVWHIIRLLSKLKDLDNIIIVELARNTLSPKVYFKKEIFITVKDHVLRTTRIIGINDLHYLNRINTDIVLVTLPPSVAIPIGVRYSKNKIPLLCDVQDVTDEYRIHFNNKLYSLIYRAYYSRIYEKIKRYNAIFTVTETMAKIIEFKTGIKPILAPNGSDPELYKESYNKYKNKQFCDPYCIGVFLGSLDWEYQRLESMIKAIYLLKTQYNLKVKLRIIGQGKMLKYYIRIAKSLGISDLVYFYGYVSIGELPEILASSDFGIVSRPSIRNNWIMSSMRMTVYDYLSAGLPILAYGPPYSYTKNFILKNKVGIYIPSDDPLIIARHVYKEINEIKSIDRGYCRSIAEKYRWEKTLSPIINYIRSLLE